MKNMFKIEIINRRMMLAWKENENEGPTIRGS